MYAAES